jgi:hypothetical protein
MHTSHAGEALVCLENTQHCGTEARSGLPQFAKLTICGPHLALFLLCRRRKSRNTFWTGPPAQQTKSVCLSDSSQRQYRSTGVVGLEPLETRKRAKGAGQTIGGLQKDPNQFHLTMSSLKRLLHDEEEDSTSYIRPVNEFRRDPFDDDSFQR